MSVLVVGVGNRLRRDDGAGPEAADRVRAARPEVDVAEVNGDASRLLDLWAGRAHVVLVDAVRTGAPPGVCHLWRLRAGEWGDAEPSSLVSSHLVGVVDAIDLGRALGRVPETLDVVGVEVLDLGSGAGLSDPVAAGLGVVVDRVLELLGPRAP